MIRRFVIASALAAVLSCALPAVHGQAAPPRLLLILMIDQMRADYVTVFQRHWRAGLRTLVSDGAVFERAEYPYLHTVTCAGHATVGTGALPRTHGIVGNEWWDRESRTLVDCMSDDRPASSHVSYGRPSRGGSSPRYLLVPTLGDELRMQRPGAHVVSLSLKPDSAIAMAGHGGDAVAWFDGEAGVFVTSRAFTGTPNRVLADFLARDSFEKDLTKVWTLLLPPDAYLSADATLGQRPFLGRDGLFPHEMSSRTGIDARAYGFWRQSPFSDRYLERMAEAMIDGLELGRDDTPDVLAIGFSALDVVGHAFGPESREVEDVLVNLDRTLGDLIAALDRRVGRDRYVLALSADHGVAPTPQPGGTGGRIIREDVQERIEDTLQAHWGRSEAGDYVDTIQASFVYFAPGVFARLRADRPVWQAVQSRLTTFPGIARVLAAPELSASSSDPVVRAAASSYVADRSGDVALIPERNWFIVTRASANATTHGGWQDHDKRVPIMMLGGGIKPGHYTQNTSPADIAPTLASLAGVSLPRAEGRVLREALH
jgi:predicted AlkP superfamily pyrophosphatase or phosphodiesterase